MDVYRTFCTSFDRDLRDEFYRHPESLLDILQFGPESGSHNLLDLYRTYDIIKSKRKTRIVLYTSSYHRIYT